MYEYVAKPLQLIIQMSFIYLTLLLQQWLFLIGYS